MTPPFFKLSLLVVAVLLYSASLAQSQEPMQTNRVYLSASTQIVNGFYERTLARTGKTPYLNPYVKVGLGNNFGDSQSPYGAFNLGLFTGKKKNHVELGLGLTAFVDFGPEPYYPSANLGWRFQKPGGKLILRAGLGMPEFRYLSAGIAF